MNYLGYCGEIIVSSPSVAIRKCKNHLTWTRWGLAMDVEGVPQAPNDWQWITVALWNVPNERRVCMYVYIYTHPIHIYIYIYPMCIYIPCVYIYKYIYVYIYISPIHMCIYIPCIYNHIYLYIPYIYINIYIYHVNTYIYILYSLYIYIQYIYIYNIYIYIYPMYIYIYVYPIICIYIYIYIYIYIPYVYTYTYASPGSMAIVGMKLAARVSCILTKTPVANVPSSVLRLRPSTKNNFVGSLKSNHPKRYKKNRQRTCFLVEFYFFYLFGVVANLLSNPGWNGFWYLWWMCCPMKPSQSNTHHPRPWGVDLAPYVLTDQFPMCTQIDSLVHSTFGGGGGPGWG